MRRRPRPGRHTPDSALGPHDPSRATPVRDFGTPATDYAWFEETPQLAVLSTATGTPLGWLRAGQALQRVLLTATVHGIAASPLTQPLETADAWLVRDPGSASESPQMILRLGRDHHENDDQHQQDVNHRRHIDIRFRTAATTN